MNSHYIISINPFNKMLKIDLNKSQSSQLCLICEHFVFNFQFSRSVSPTSRKTKTFAINGSPYFIV